MRWRIPLFDLSLGEEERSAVDQVLSSGWLSMGELTRRFEEEFARYIGVRYGVATTSGTAALHLALEALGIGPGDEVICPSLSFIATASAILYTGAQPVFAEIEEELEPNLSPESIASLITPKTKAVLVLHYAGYPCRMERIMAIASDNRLFVIEDAAHAPGAELEGRRCGGIGHIGCFSFFANKNLTTGEGGMVVVNDEGLFERLRILRSHGMTASTYERFRKGILSYDVVALGYNYRLDELRSALGLVQLQRLDEQNLQREALTNHYRRLLNSVEEVELPFLQSKGRSAYHIFPILLKDGVSRERLAEFLRGQGVQTSIHYPPIHRFSLYQKRLGPPRHPLPRTEWVGSHELTLPLYPGMSFSDVEYVVASLKAGIQAQSRSGG